MNECMDPRLVALAKLAETLGYAAVTDYSVEIKDRGLGWARVRIQFDGMVARQDGKPLVVKP